MPLPTLTRTLDDDFVNTWYEIRAEVADNVLESNVISLALKEAGCMVTQIGGEFVTRTIGYGKKNIQHINKGSVLTQNAKDLDTMAIWDWRYFLVDINRSLVDDSKNSGKFKIKSYLERRLGAARDAIVQDYEGVLTHWSDFLTGITQPNGLYDICPNKTAETNGSSPWADGTGGNSDSQTSGTSNGGISRANNYWKNWVGYDDASANKTTKIAGPTNEPYSLNLVPDMKHFFNSINANQEAPTFILMDQDIYEAYEDEVGDKQQIVRTSFDKKAADLGFVTMTFKGATMTYSSKLDSTKHIFMLNLNHIECVYDPNLWFDMTDWMSTPNQLERVAYIVCMTTGLITDQPRRHGVMEYAS